MEHSLFSRASFFSADAQQAGDSMDALAQAVGIQSRLNEAVEMEDFALAATLRDELKTAKVRCFVISLSRASSASTKLMYCTR